MRLPCCTAPITLLLIPLCLAACGAGAGTDTNASPPPPAIERSFAYVADDFSNTVSTYSINPATGELTRWQQYAQLLLISNEFFYVD